MQKKIVKTIIHSVRDNDIHMPNNSTQDTWDWLLQCAEASCLLVNHLDMLEKIKIKDDYNFQETTYESSQRNSKNLILGDRVPNSKTKEVDLMRIQRIIELQKEFLSLTGLQNLEIKEPITKKKGKKK